MTYFKTLLLATTALTFTFCGGNKPKPEPVVEPEPVVVVPEGPSAEEILRREIQELSQQIASQVVYFEFNQAGLDAENRAALSRISNLLQTPAGAYLSILAEGHTDAVGSEEYNLALGERRAQIVKEYLAQSGANDSDLSTISFGEEKLAVGSLEKEPKNRRVTFNVSVK
jgi:peptidoglycan-associated lipoprotein